VRRVSRAESVSAIVNGPRSVVGQVALGRALLLTCAAIVTSTLWAVHPSTLSPLALALTAAGLLAVVVLSPYLPWDDDRSRLALLFPLTIFAALTVLGVAGNGAAVAYTGFINLCFVYVGLTQPAGTSVALAPIAAVVWIAAQDSWSAAASVRLAIGVLIWILVGELLSLRTDQAAKDHQILSRHAHVDALTGLINRRALDARLAEARGGDTIVMCDLDHFKDLNDREGHAAGDRVLADFGGLLIAALRGEDAAGRYGGEEFVLLLTETSPEAALDVLIRMRVRWASIHPGLTFSSGIAAVTDSAPIANALTAADEALYASKQAGRNCDHISYQQIVRGN